jgi:hypothetical protein
MIFIETHIHASDWITLLQSSVTGCHLMGAHGLLAALTQTPRNEAVMLEMIQEHMTIVVDALYAPMGDTRHVMLHILNILMQEEDARKQVIDMGCIPAFVSMLLDPDLPLDGQRWAAKALSKLALSRYARHPARAPRLVKHVYHRSRFLNGLYPLSVGPNGSRKCAMPCNLLSRKRHHYTRIMSLRFI